MRIRILVIDDEESYCEILKYNLQREGYEVDTAESAEEALRLDLSIYQLMIVDIMMERIRLRQTGAQQSCHREHPHNLLFRPQRGG